MDWKKRIAERFLKLNEKADLWRKVLLPLMAVVVFITSYALILPAISIDKDAADKQTGIYLHDEDDQFTASNPVFHFSPENNSYEITVKCDKSATMSAATSLEVKEIHSDDSLYRTYRKELTKKLDAKSGKKIKALHLYSLTFKDRDGMPVPFNTDAEISINYRKSLAVGADSEIRAFSGLIPEDSDWIGVKAERNKNAVNSVSYHISKEGITGIAVIENAVAKTDKADKDESEKASTEEAKDSKEENKKEAADKTEAKDTETVNAPDEKTQESDKKTEEKPESADDTIKTLTAEGEDYKVTLSYDQDSGIPAKGVSLKVKEIAAGSKDYNSYVDKAESCIEKDKEISHVKLYDITILADGKELEPEAPVQVHIEANNMPAEKDAEICMVHIPDKGKAKRLNKKAVKFETGKKAVKGVEFMAEESSVYGIVYTVDFHWEVDGKMYDFSIPGGGYISLETLIETLGVAKEGSDAKEFVSAVEKVEFSDPALVWTGQADEDTTVGELKKKNNLDIEYSSDMTFIKKWKLNRTRIQAGDWALISLRPFSSLETLTVTMKSGEVFTIKVTDAQIRNDFIAASDKLFEITVTYGEDAQIPDQASLKITEFAEDSKEYKKARELVAGEEEDLGLTAFDLSILDKDGRQVEPKAAVMVSVKMKSLPEGIEEKEARNSVEIHHLDESSGDVKVEKVASTEDGNVQIENETAQADFPLESFSTFTISWPASTNNTYTTLRWTYGNGNQSRVYVQANYVDQNGNPISRPADIGWTVDQWVGDNGEVSINLEDALAKDIPGYTFDRVYISNNGDQSTVTNAVGKTEGGWGWRNNTLRFYDGETEVYNNGNYNNQNQYGAPNNLLYLVYSGGPHTTIHYGYMDGDTFVEFDEQPGPTNTSTSFGWAHLIYDFAGTDDQGLHVDWKYSGTYYHTSPTTNPEQGGTAVQPILRYYNNAWRYYNGNISSQNDTRNNNNWKSVADGSDIYLVYEKPVIPMGGTPTPKESSEKPDAPYILKESTENGDGTNTLSLSVTGSRAPMVTDKVADVIVILDLSSSMRRDIGSQTAYDNNYQTNARSRYYQAKLAVQRLADTLYAANGEDGEKYRMGLITFSNKATIRRTPTEDQDAFQSVLDGITAYEGSGTNWEHSLQLANRMAVSSDRATYIVFITDGEPSVRQTRGNLTNEQLSGNNVAGQVGNPSYNPAQEGDIFHGGLAGGQFFNRNGDYSTPDFRDYLGSATFGGLMNNDVWDARNRNAAVDEVASIVGHNKGFYAIGVSEDVNYLGEFVEAGGVDENHYKLVTSATAFQEVIDDILEELDISGSSGQADVKVYDGITNLTQTIAKVNQEEGRLVGADGNFVYYRSTAPEGWSSWTSEEKTAYALGVQYADSEDTPEEYESFSPEEIAAYNKGKNISFTEWAPEEMEAAHCDPAVYNTETGAVEWNMGETFMLEDGVTYKVSFICWPSQEAYDIIAKLKNGTLNYDSDLTDDQRAQIHRDGDTYTLKTNEDGANTTYHSATLINDTVTVGDPQDPLLFQPVIPLNLAKDKFNVAKTWEASKIDSTIPEPVEMQVWGGNEMYKDFTITPVDIGEGSTTPNLGRSEDIYISCGLLKVNKSTGAVVIYESGHDFELREVKENSRHWDLSASTCHPMVINNTRTMLILVEGDDIPEGMRNNPDLAYLNVETGDQAGEYYRIGDKVYRDTGSWADLSGLNTRRSFLDLSKEVLVDGSVWNEPVDTKFTYKIKIDIDPVTLSWDPDLEKYIIISIRDANGVVSPASVIGDQEYQTTAKLPSECGFDESYNSRYLVAETGVEFYLSLKTGWSVRFLNLPVGTEYNIEEVLPADSDYTFDNVRIEKRKDQSSANPDETDTYPAERIYDSIDETSTLYKVVYQNEAKSHKIRILKTRQDASTPLGGAKFDLYTESAYTASPQGDPFKKDLVSSSETETMGQIDLGSLPVGVYYLVETYAPPGFLLRTDPVVITVSKTDVTYDDGTTLPQSGSGISQIGDVYQLKVTNDEGASLPSTGGIGTGRFTIFGTLLLLLAGAAWIIMKKQNTIRQ